MVNFAFLPVGLVIKELVITWGVKEFEGAYESSQESSNNGDADRESDSQQLESSLVALASVRAFIELRHSILEHPVCS